MLARGDENVVTGHGSQGGLTVLTYTNTAGTCRCRSMVNGKDANPHALKEVKVMLVIYCSNKHFWIMQKLTAEWFDCHFIVEAEEHWHKMGLPEN